MRYFKNNSVFHDIFDVDDTVFDGPLERQIVEKNSEEGKYRATEMKKSRKTKLMVNNYILEDQEI